MQRRALLLARHDAERLAQRRQSELALRVERDQTSLERLAAGLLVDRAGQAAIPHRVGGAGVRIARRSHGRDGRHILALGRLLTERVAPLVVSGRRLDDPCRGHGRFLGLGADVVQHHEQDILAVGRAGRRLAVRETVYNKRAGIDEPALAFLALARWQERGPRVFRRAVAVCHLPAVVHDGLLADDQRRLASRGQPYKIFQ